jgi:uncharacterized membrane protein
MKFYKLSTWFWSLLLLTAGAVHFAYPSFFVAYYPNYLPWPEGSILISGVAEWVLAALLWRKNSQQWAWILTCVLMCLYLPVHVYVITYHASIQHPPLAIPLWIAWLRLPIQLLFIYWTYWCARQRF